MSLPSLAELFLLSLWYILPSYIANMSPVIFGGGKPLDMGKMFIDGRRILGDHKTVRGFLSGVSIGTLVGAFQGRFLAGFLLSLGAMLGDSLGSFIKRRLRYEPGDYAPFIDEEIFLMLSILLAYPAEPLDLPSIAFLFIVTPLLHRGTNAIANKLGLRGDNR